MNEVTVVARIDAKAGREDEVPALPIQRMAEAVRRHEPDCLVDCPHRSAAGPAVFLSDQQYRSRAPSRCTGRRPA